MLIIVRGIITNIVIVFIVFVFIIIIIIISIVVITIVAVTELDTIIVLRAFPRCAVLPINTATTDTVFVLTIPPSTSTSRSLCALL